MKGIIHILTTVFCDTGYTCIYSSNSSHNQMVKKLITDQLTAIPNESSEDTIRGMIFLSFCNNFGLVAVQRKYECIRKQYLEEQKENYEKNY